jgi:glycosyltransferase involved in cell wall biosynthesis
MIKPSDSLQGILCFIFSVDDWQLLCEDVSSPTINVAFDSRTVSRLKAHGIECADAHSYLSREDWEGTADSSVEWIKRWPYMKMGRRSPIEWFRLDDFSLWWQLEGLLYYEGAGSYAEVGGFYNAAKLITLIRRIIAQEEPDEVRFVDRGDLRSRMIKHLLDTMDVTHQPVDVRLGLPTLKENLSYRIKTGSLHWLWDLRLHLQHRWRGWAYRLAKTWRRRQKGKLRILLVSEQGAGMRSYVDPRNGQIRYGDFYFAGIQEALLQDKEIQSTELHIRIPEVGFAPWLEDLRCILDRDRDYVPVEAFEGVAKIRSSLRVRRELRQVWNTLRQDDEFRNSLVLEGVDLYPILHDQLAAVILHSSIIQWRRTQTYREALRRLSPDVVLMNRHNTAMVDACNLEDVPLVELEHGTWSRFPAVLLRYYQYLDDVEDDLTRPLPRAIAVWGSYMRNLLKRWNYPKNRIVVTGYPAYDRLQHIDTSSVHRFAEQAGLDPAKKTIVYMTGNPWMELYQTPQEQVETARTLLQAIEKLPDVQLVIKAHQYDDADLYRQLQNELGAESHSVVLQKCDTTLLIAASEAIIAKGSSTLLEAAIAQKPVIMINFSNKPDMFDFRKYGIGPYIDDVDDIPDAVKTVLYDEGARKQMARARDDFVDEWACGADGKASNRLANLLRKLAREHQA